MAPYSPDLNPMDYSIWSILETKACAKAHTNVESLKVLLRREWAIIPQETLRAAVEAFPRRLKAVIEKRGGNRDTERKRVKTKEILSYITFEHRVDNSTAIRGYAYMQSFVCKVLSASLYSRQMD
ncbi:hypothetical protein LOD99_3100 [Oopsacas minuta]|uniref:Transposase n=1 Tax=Oopsacas minuta TaxID=111878 RepID=A0AAV7JY99_9METZ|nr:hypothetical protein LOD99_3100 [Oopsacas minuta]